MPVGSYVVGVTSVIAGLFFLMQPAPDAEPTWWESFSQWVLHSHPAPSYSKLPLFGVAPDVILRVSHGITGMGFHRRYHLDVQLQKEDSTINLEGCNVVAEWRMPRDVIVDQWLLHRTSPARWEFVPLDGTATGPLIDLEAPAYSPAARPFQLRASVPWREQQLGQSSLRIEIPDITLRYQAASACPTRRSAPVYLHPPRVSLQCSEEGMITTKAKDEGPEGWGRVREMVIRVEETGERLRTLEMSVPIAAPLVWINNTTYSVVLLSLFYLLFRLYKA